MQPAGDGTEEVEALAADHDVVECGITPIDHGQIVIAAGFGRLGRCAGVTHEADGEQLAGGIAIGQLDHRLPINRERPGAEEGQPGLVQALGQRQGPVEAQLSAQIGQELVEPRWLVLRDLNPAPLRQGSIEAMILRHLGKPALLACQLGQLRLELAPVERQLGDLGACCPGLTLGLRGVPLDGVELAGALVEGGLDGLQLASQLGQRHPGAGEQDRCHGCGHQPRSPRCGHGRQRSAWERHDFSRRR